MWFIIAAVVVVCIIFALMADDSGSSSYTSSSSSSWPSSQGSDSPSDYDVAIRNRTDELAREAHERSMAFEREKTAEIQRRNAERAAWSANYGKKK